MRRTGNVGVKLRPADCCAGSARSGVPPVRFGLHIFPAARAYHPDLRAAVSHADRRRPVPERTDLVRVLTPVAITERDLAQTGPRRRQHLARPASDPSGASDLLLSPVTVLTRMSPRSGCH